MLTLTGHRGRRGSRVVATDSQHPAISRGTVHIGMFESITRAIKSGSFAVPQAEHAVIFFGAEDIRLLRAPDRSDGQFFIKTRFKMNAVFLEIFLCFPQLEIKTTER